MAQAQRGDIVKVHYTGTLQDGSTFDSSEGREPLQFTLGERMLIPAFEDAVVGMSIGESKSVEVRAEDAYGPYIDEMVVEFDRNQVPPGFKPEVGMHLQITQEDGSVVPVKVVSLTDDKICLDANHPLAGKDLTFKITLVEVIGR